MASYNYSTQNYEKDKMARAVGRDLPISTKQSIEICSTLRKMVLQKAKALLSRVITKDSAIKYRRFNDDLGHKPGIGPGAYPVKASSEILSLLESVEYNAQVKGLSSGNLVISHICAHKASRPMHGGRKRSRITKRTHIEIVVEEKLLEKSKSDKDKKNLLSKQNKKTN